MGDYIGGYIGIMEKKMETTIWGLVAQESWSGWTLGRTPST